ncbi:MAG: cytochrome P450 family protein, partial [Acidimicrobiales bacterium]
AHPRLSTDGRRFARSRRPDAAGGGAGAGERGGDRGEAGLGAVSLFDHMLSTDPPDHTRLRRLVSQAFTPRRIETLRPRIEEIAGSLLDGLAGLDQVELIGDFAFPFPIRVICELLGVPVADQGRFRRWFTTMLTAGGGGEAGRAAAGEAGAQVAGYITELLAAKRDRPCDDLVSALVAARDGSQALGERELVSMVFLLLLAGHETTVNLIGNGVAGLLLHPDQLELLRTSPELIPGAVEELLRYDGPVQHPTLRFTTEAVQLGGTTIPAGAIVLVALGSADRDPARFEMADDLDIRRAPDQHLAFGHGIHFCLGAPLARMEVQVALFFLLGRFPHLALAVAPEELDWRDGIFLRGLRSLPLRLSGASPARG